MHVADHRLRHDDGTPVRFVPSPRHGGIIEPKFIIIHYTAGQSAEAAIAWLTRKSRGPSTHLIIARDGTVTQLVDLNRVAFHAGKSAWGEFTDLNDHSIGIELDNAGPMRLEGKEWKSTFKKKYEPDQVVEQPHKHAGKYQAWHVYPRAQIDALVEVLQALSDHYAIDDTLGHDDISPGRKWDPGPAFPMEEVKARVVGKSGKRLAAKDRD